MWLLLLLLRASALFIVTFGLARLFRKRSADFQADLWRATFVATALLPVATWFLPSITWTTRAPQRAEVAIRPTDRAAGLAATGKSVNALATPEELTHSNGAAHVLSVETATEPSVEGLPGTGLPIAKGLIVLWALVATVLLLRLALGIARASSIARRSRAVLEVHPSTAIATSEDVEHATAFVWDPRPFGRPRIVVHPGLDGPWRKSVLAHELHHVTRRDGAFVVLSGIVSALYWPTPLAMLARRRLRIEIERAADDAVLRAGVPASEYASGLLALGRAPVDHAVPAMSARVPLTTRVESLIAPRRDRRVNGRRLRSLVFASALLGAMPVVALSYDVVQERAGKSATADEASTLRSRALGALVRHYDEGAGAWRGHVGYKLNHSWRVTHVNAPHVGVTALAVEALVRSGIDLDASDAGKALRGGIEFLLSAQEESGYIRANGTRMRSHAQATRALSEVLGAELAIDVLEPLERAFEFALDARSDESGAWRHEPNAESVDIIETARQFDAQYRAGFETFAARAQGEGADSSEFERLEKDAFRQYAAEHRWTNDESPNFGAFRFQLNVRARTTPNTTAAGLLLSGRRAHEDAERGLRLDRAAIDFMARERTRRRSTWRESEHHFLVWDLELLAARAFDSWRRVDRVMENVTIRDSENGTTSQHKLVRLALGGSKGPSTDDWNAGTRDWLANHELASGGWRVTTGPGHAWATAIGCLLLVDD